MRWNELRSVGDEFFAHAPVRTTVDIKVPVTPDRLWQALAADDAVLSWSPLVTGTTWRGDRGVGAVRTVTIARALSVREVFYRWDENSRMTFAAEATTGPGIRVFAEDYVITARPDGAALSWTVALDLPAGARLLGTPASLALRPAISSLARGLRAQLTR
ncbi:SRPBCC family protein [Gordonia sp. L191]|uniref:SRPBCC family protein n=1 Tax=Gordonia sp. L191 TaxID=2982699 RepID=UPI0024C080AD|nr:SRPBCC family protein [Gordonia sp. L191]WHU47812.1 SRPBCC family protein [Gordonia sp. L191]